MSSTNSPTLIIDVRSRRAEACLSSLILSAALLAPWLIDAASGAAAFAASLGMAAVVACGLRRAGWLGGPGRIVSIAWISDGRWILTDRAGAPVQATLQPSTRVGRRLVWLHWRTEARSHSLLLTSADASDADLRRLTVRLRIEGLMRGASTAPAV